MMEELILLKNYILETPASQSKHQQALDWLNKVLQENNKKIQQLQEQLQKKSQPDKK